MRLLLLSVFIASLLTGLVAFANFIREGTATFSNGPWLYVGYFVVITVIVIFGTLLMQRFGGK